MKVKIRVFGLTPHDDGEEGSFTISFDAKMGVLDRSKQYSLDELDAVIHKEGAARGSVAHVIAAAMRTTLEGQSVGDVTVEELYNDPHTLTHKGMDLFSAYRSYSLPIKLDTDKKIYQAFMTGIINQQECDELLKTVDREGNAERFKEKHGDKYYYGDEG